jgi:uncharacterized protein (DUF1330 family)
LQKKQSQSINQAKQKNDLHHPTHLHQRRKRKHFHQFEDIAIPAISKYNGRLLLRVRPDNNSIIENNIDKPYEIHLVEFNTEEDFQNFMHDEDVKSFFI